MTLPPAIARLFPFLRWRRPTPAMLKQDLWAGITVGLVVVPQALAYAALAGMPPHTGLYAALLPSIVGILWGSSALLAVGPVALTGILVFGSLSSMSTPGSEEWIALAIWLAIYSGIIQFLLGAFRMGKIACLVSQPVMLGFINAAAIIIILSQLPHLLGIRVATHAWRHEIGQMISLSPATMVTAAFGCGALLLLLTLKRFAPRLPGMLIVTVLGILASRLVDYAGLGGAVVGALPSGLPSLAPPPPIPFERHCELLPAALILAIVSFTEAMSSCRAIARKTNERWDENQELIGQGLAKVVSGFSGSFAVSGAISRSALNLYAGAKTVWASLIAAVSVLFSLLFLTSFIRDLPYSVLAAMIITPVFALVDFRALRKIFIVSGDDGWVALATLIVTLAFSPRLHIGVFVGVTLTMVSYLYRRTHPRIIEVAQHADGTLRDRARFELSPLAPGVLAIRMDAAFNFMTAGTLERYITERTMTDISIKRVLVCASGINDIDATGVETLIALCRALHAKGIELYVSAVKKQVWDVLDRAGVSESMGRDRFYDTDGEAILSLRIG